MSHDCHNHVYCRERLGRFEISINNLKHIDSIRFLRELADMLEEPPGESWYGRDT